MKRTGEKLSKDEGGFTLPEVLVTITMMITVLFALYSVFDMGVRVFALGNNKLEAVENARLGLEKMAREIRAAYPYDVSDSNPDNNHLFFDTSDPSNPDMPQAAEITFGNELNGDGKIECGSPCEYITYKLSGTTLMRNTTATGSTSNSGDQPVVEFVNPAGPNGGLAFEYLTSDGTEINPSSPGSFTQADIDRVRITLDIRVQDGQQNATQTLTTDVYLRNQDIASNPSGSSPDDTDGDGVPNDSDACPDEPGAPPDGCPSQPDSDGDEVPDDTDNCSTTSNPDQADRDSDGVGDACDDDRDGDGVPNASDDCPDSPNPGDGCPATGISVNDASVSEGNSGTKNLTFTVTRDGELNRTSTVDYATANGTATAGSDYDATSGTLTFAPHETTKTVNVTVRGDTTVETDETFTLNLYNPTRATITDNQGVGTIVNDDAPPDNTPPVVTITSGPSGTVTSTSATFEFTANEPSTFECRLDGGAWTSCTSPRSYTGLSGGAHTFEVRARDTMGNLSSPASRTWTVNRAPDARDDSAETRRNRAIDINVLANDTDPDGDTLTVVSFTQPSRGTVTRNTDGTLRFTPANGPQGHGTFTFQYTASDGKGGTDTATVTVVSRP